MRLGFKTMPQHITWDELLAVWREVDADERYDSAWVFDHFYPIHGDSSGPCLESWVSLSALAQATTRVRVGSMVNGAPYRHPAVFAAMASTLDIVSGGRLELGLGAGWNEEEADAYGIDLGTWTERFDRLEEYLVCVTGLLRDEVTNFDGAHFHLTAARNEPKGPQRPGPPIVIGGAGPRRTLPIVARFADHWNHPGGSPEQFAESLARLHECCHEIGRDPSEIQSSVHVICAADSPTENVVADVEALSAAGLDHAIVYPFGPYDTDLVGRLADGLEHLLA